MARQRAPWARAARRRAAPRRAASVRCGWRTDDCRCAGQGGPVSGPRTRGAGAPRGWIGYVQNTSNDDRLASAPRRATCLARQREEMRRAGHPAADDSAAAPRIAASTSKARRWRRPAARGAPRGAQAPGQIAERRAAAPLRAGRARLMLRAIAMTTSSDRQIARSRGQAACPRSSTPWSSGNPRGSRPPRCSRRASRARHRHR